MTSIVIQSILHHRGAAHDMYEFKHPIVQKIMYILALIFLGPSYLSPRTYAIMHRMHHAYADTDADPHRPYNGFWGVFRTMWLTARRYDAIHKGEQFLNIDGNKVLIGEKFKKNLMDWPMFDKIFHTWPARISFIAIYFVTYYFIITEYNLSPIFYGMVILHSIMAPLHGAIVNYYAHIYGDAPNKVSDTSKNMPWFARNILRLFGELLHNNHHAKPASPDFSLGNPDLHDNGYLLLKSLEGFGLIKIKRLV